MYMQSTSRVYKAWSSRLPGRATLIANPQAGSGKSQVLINRLADVFNQAGITCTVKLTEKSGDATKFAAAEMDSTDLLVVIGGDGTVNEVLQAAKGGQPPVLIVPAGTENVLAKYLGLTSSPVRMLEVIREAWTVRFDLGCLQDRRFSMLASVGFDAAIVHNLHAERSGNITHFTYFWPLWRQFWQYDWPVLSVVADDKEVFHGRGMIVVGNISRYAMGLRICSDALPTDGLLDLFIMQCENRWQLLRWVTLIAARMHKRLPQAVYVRAKRIAIDSASRTKIPVEVDGDPAGLLPIEMTIASVAVPLLCHRDEKGKFLPRRANGER